MNTQVKNGYVWVISGKQRLAVTKALNKPLTASLIKAKTNIKVTNISDVLRAMVKLKLAIVLNQRDKRNRVYELTDLGKAVRKEILDL